MIPTLLELTHICIQSVAEWGLGFSNPPGSTFTSKVSRDQLAVTWNLTVTGTLSMPPFFTVWSWSHTNVIVTSSSQAKARVGWKRSKTDRRRLKGWYNLLATGCVCAACDWRAQSRTSPNPRRVGSIPYSCKYGRTLFFACTSDCHSFNRSARHKKTVNSEQIHKALSHIDPYGALFSRIGKAIDPGLSAAANILLSVPRPWSIVFF